MKSKGTMGLHAGFSDSSDCSTMEEDPLAVSIQLLTDGNSDSGVCKAYQGMVSMLDNDLQVMCAQDKTQFLDLPESLEQNSSDIAIPSLATVLFFNGTQEQWKVAGDGYASGRDLRILTKPDLLLNHMWNGCHDLEHDFQNSLNLNADDVVDELRFDDCKNHKSCPKRSRTSPFLRYDAILKESKENEMNAEEMKERDIGFRKEIFDFEVAERTLEARKQLETWPWEFHHKAHTAKGISQCHGNAQNFFAYQPDRDITRLYGDVIDTTKISRKKSLSQIKSNDGLHKLRNGEREEDGDKSNESKKSPVATTDYPLMAVREVHYGRQHLRYTVFVSADTWTDQVEFYRLLLRRHDVTLRDGFCFFTIYYGENTDIQFALKKLSPKQSPIPLRSTVLQFKVNKVGNLVPLLPNACRPISDTRWQTKDHDGNILLLQICPCRCTSDTSSVRYGNNFNTIVGAVTPSLELRNSSDEHDDEFSLERLDSFVESELPARMPLFQHSIYSTLSGRPRFGSRTTTSSASPVSSSSTSPERRPRRLDTFTQRMLTLSSLEVGSTSTLPNPRRATKTGNWTSSWISESSDEPENTNFYRRAKFRKDTRRKSDGTVKPPVPKPRSKSLSKTAKQKQKTPTRRKSKVEEETEVYV